MPVYEISAPNGKVYRISGPPGASDDDVRSAVVAQHPDAGTPLPQENSKLRGLALGALEPIDNVARGVHALGVRYAPAATAAVDKLNTRLGMDSTVAVNARRDAMRTANTRAGYQTIGNIAGTVPTMAIRGGLAVQGAASGAALSDKRTAGGVLTDAGVGAVTSLVGGKALSALGAVARPVASKAANVLREAGINLSPGQLAQSSGTWVGKALRGLEDKARSAPILGAFIGGSRDRAATDLNHAVVNGVLDPIKKTAPKTLAAGHDLLDHAEAQLSGAYQRVIPNLVGHIDKQFGTDLASAKAKTNVLPTARQRQFQAIVRDVFTNRTPDGHTISGQSLKDAESRLTKLAGNYSKSGDADQRILGEALFDVRQSLRAMAIRSNPQSGAELQAINKGWARLKQARSAADQNGIITPGRLVRAANKSGHGKELARAASSLMPDHVPNSGTTDRAAQMLLLSELAGGGGLAASGHPLLSAAGVTSTLAAAAPYTKLGQRALNYAAFAKRPQAVQFAGRSLQSLSRGAPAVVPPLLARRRER